MIEENGHSKMVRALIIFSVLTAISGLFGFGLIETQFVMLAQLVFWVFAILLGATVLSRLIGDHTVADVFD